MTIFEKLQSVQSEMKAPKNLTNRFGGYNYRNAEGICEAFKPYGKKYSLALTLSDEIVEVGNRIYVKATATLIDIEGKTTTSVSAFAREAEVKKGMDDSQITGAASSYARKYALNGLFLLDDTKDPDTEEYQSRGKSEPKADMPQGKQDDDLIDQARVNVLINLLAQTGIKQDVFLQMNGLKRFEDMTMKQFDFTSEGLRERIKRKAKEKK